MRTFGWTQCSIQECSCKGTGGSGHLRLRQVKHRWNYIGTTTQTMGTMGCRRLPGARRPRNKGQEAGSFLSSSAWKVFLQHLDFRIWFLFSPKVCRNSFPWPLEYNMSSLCLPISEKWPSTSLFWDVPVIPSAHLQMIFLPTAVNS